MEYMLTTDYLCLHLMEATMLMWLGQSAVKRTFSLHVKEVNGCSDLILSISNSMQWPTVLARPVSTDKTSPALHMVSLLATTPHITASSRNRTKDVESRLPPDSSVGQHSNRVQDIILVHCSITWNGNYTCQTICSFITHDSHTTRHKYDETCSGKILIKNFFTSTWGLLEAHTSLANGDWLTIILTLIVCQRLNSLHTVSLQKSHINPSWW